MKPSVLRICSAFLLMAIAVSVSLGVLATAVDEPQKAEESYVWIRLPLRTSPLGKIYLYTAEGLPAGSLTADESGKAVTGPLPAAVYYAVTEDCCCEFSLSQHAEVAVLGGSGRFDGQTLHLDGTEAGRVILSRQNDTDAWLEYTLSDGKRTLRRVLKAKAGEPAVCIFEGVPFGSYRVEENGIFRCNVTVSAENASISISLP